MYKVIKSWLCVLLAITMLCTNTGMIVFAAEGMKQDTMAEAMEETSLEDISTNDTSAEEVREDEEVLEDVLGGEEITAKEENDIEDVGIEAKDLEEVSETSEEGIIASGEYKEDSNDITWVIDADGKLTVEGTGILQMEVLMTGRRGTMIEILSNLLKSMLQV